MSYWACRYGDLDGGGWDKDDMRFHVSGQMHIDLVRSSFHLKISRVYSCSMQGVHYTSLFFFLSLSNDYSCLVFQRINWQVGSVNGNFIFIYNSVIIWFCSV